MKIALAVDNPKRDLKGLAILGYDLAMRGHQVFLVPMNLQSLELERLMPDWFITSGYRKTTYDTYKYLSDLGIKLAVLETEGGFMYNEDMLFERIETHKGSNDIIDLFFCWGEKYKEVVKRFSNIDEGKVFVTGNPRFELKKTDVLVRDKILFSPNFAFVRNGQPPTGFINACIRMHGIDLNHTFDGIVDYYEYFISVVQLASVRFPGKVVYRPHPFEDMDYLLPKLSGLNVQIDQNFSISETLVEAAVTIQNSSTTGFESVLYGVPTIIPRGVNSNFRAKEIEDMSYILDSDEAILAHIERALKHELLIDPSAREALEYACMTSQNSSQLICDIFSSNEYINSHKLSKAKFSTVISFKNRLKRFLILLKKGKLDFNFWKYNKYSKWRESFKFFDSNKVIEILNEYRDNKIEITDSCSKFYGPVSVMMYPNATNNL
jgi:surface carbohydrate biosynthesis protein